MLKVFAHVTIFMALTALTQIGGIVWLASLMFRCRIPAFVVLYTGISVVTLWTAPLFGRTALSCWGNGPLLVQSWIYCALNRNYVAPEMEALLLDAAKAVDRGYPGTITLVLDANFPFVTGFPLLPHLSHDDGEKADLAFYYANDEGYVAGATRSPIGYFAFEEGPSNCSDAWPSLRWDMTPLQTHWRDYDLDEARTRFLLSTLANDNRVGKIFLEPHLKSHLRLFAGKIRFQGCRAARHDDHIHIQL